MPKIKLQIIYTKFKYRLYKTKNQNEEQTIMKCRTFISKNEWESLKARTA